MASPHICPTCESVLPENHVLKYFAGTTSFPPEADDLTDWYEQIEKCIGWLGALAAAGPYAVAYAADEKHPYEWVENLVWLAKELTRETEQRMDRLAKAIGIQNDRLEKQQACRTEG